MNIEREREKWINDVEARQKNYVFPYTLRNQTEGVRRIYQSGKPLSPLLLAGFLLLLVGSVLSLVFLLAIQFQSWKDFDGPLPAKFLAMFGPYLAVLAGFGLLVYLLGRAAKRSLKQIRNKDEDHR